MNVRLGLVTALSILALSTTGSASETETQHTPLIEKKPPKQWYGWQILASDTATVATTLVWMSAHNNELYGQLNFTTGYFLGAPIVHLAHGNYVQAAASVGMRAGLPFVAAMTGCAVSGDSGVLGCLPGALIGLLVGMTAATAIDASVLSYADAKPKPKTFEVLPSASLSKSGATFGLQGVF